MSYHRLDQTALSSFFFIFSCFFCLCSMTISIVSILLFVAIHEYAFLILGIIFFAVLLVLKNSSINIGYDTNHIILRTAFLRKIHIHRTSILCIKKIKFHAFTENGYMLIFVKKRKMPFILIASQSRDIANTIDPYSC